MLSCQFWEIFKDTFFIEHLQWLLLLILKLLDSQRQWCKWISKSVKIYFISTFLVLVGVFVFIFGEHELSFYISTGLWLRKYGVFDFPIDHAIEVSRDFLGGASSSWVSALPTFGIHGPCESWYKTSRDFVRGGSVVLSHELARFKIHRSCESGDTTFFICHVTTTLKCHVTFRVGSSHLNSTTG